MLLLFVLVVVCLGRRRDAELGGERLVVLLERLLEGGDRDARRRVDQVLAARLAIDDEDSAGGGKADLRQSVEAIGRGLL